MMCFLFKLIIIDELESALSDIVSVNFSGVVRRKNIIY